MEQNDGEKKYITRAPVDRRQVKDRRSCLEVEEYLSQTPDRRTDTIERRENEERRKLVFAATTDIGLITVNIPIESKLGVSRPKIPTVSSLTSVTFEYIWNLLTYHLTKPLPRLPPFASLENRTF